MAIFPPQKSRGRPRKNRKVAEFQKIDVRDLFRAHPNLHGHRLITLSLAGRDVDVHIKYHDSATPRPQPVFICSQCEKGARVLFGVTPASARDQPVGIEPDESGTGALICRRCAKADPDSHNLTGEQRSLRRTAQLRTLLKNGTPRHKAKWQHVTTHARLSRGLKREAQVREEIQGLCEAGVSRLEAERSAAKATGTLNPVELSDQELIRALRAFRRAKVRKARKHLP